MALDEEQGRRLNNLVSAAKSIIPGVINTLDGLDNLEATYAAFQASGLVVANIVDADFVGGNDYISASTWADFVYAVGVLNNSVESVMSAYLAILDTVPL